MEVLFVDRDAHGRACVRPFERPDLITAAVEFGLTMMGAPGVARMDSAGKRLDAQQSLQRFFHDASQRALDGFREEAKRNDAFSAGMGNAEPLDLTFITNEILTQRMPELHGLELFRTDATLCKPGAAFYRQDKEFLTGEAAIHGGGPATPQGDVARTRSGPRPTRYLVSSARISRFEMLAADFQQRDTLGKKLKASNRAIAELHNDLTWNGNSAFDIWGVLTYPYMDKAVSAVPLTSSSTPAQIMASFTSFANRARLNSKAVYAPNAVVMADTIESYLSTTLVDVGNGSNVTILEMLKKMLPGIKKWSAAYELNNAGPSSTDGVLFYRDDEFGPNIVTPIETTMLPTQTMGFDDITILFKQIGGAHMREAANQTLVWYECN